MNTWWKNLSLRERSFVSGLGIIACLLLFYFIIWQPLSGGVKILKQGITNDQALLSWMQQVATVIQQNQYSQDDSAQTISANQRLAVIQTSLKNTSFNKYVTQIEQTNQNDVRIVIKSVSFDDLTDWLILLWKQDGIIVSDITLKRLNDQGLASANITLTGNKTS